MKNKKVLIIIISLIITIVALILFFIIRNFKNEEYNSKKTNKIIDYKGSIDLSLIKNAIGDKEYYQFEDNGKNYIFFKVKERVYAPAKIKINTVTIKDFYYEDDNKLKISLDIDKTKTKNPINNPEIMIDGISEDVKEIYIETDKNFSQLVINDEIYERFKGGIIRNKEMRKYGYIDKNGKIVIPIDYNGIKEIDTQNYKGVNGQKINLDYSNYLMINNDDGIGIYDKQGKKHIECKYSKIIYFGENTFIVVKKVNDSDKFGVVDIDDNIILDFIDGYVDMDTATNLKFIIFSINENYIRYKGIIDRDFNIILEPKYSDITLEKVNEDVYFIVEQNKKRAVLNSKGEKEIDFCDLSIYDIRKELQNSKL